LCLIVSWIRKSSNAGCRSGSVDVVEADADLMYVAFECVIIAKEERKEEVYPER